MHDTYGAALRAAQTVVFDGSVHLDSVTDDYDDEQAKPKWSLGHHQSRRSRRNTLIRGASSLVTLRFCVVLGRVR